MATKYNIDYNDKRFTEVEADKKAALNEVDVQYGNMISSSDKYYQDQINATKDYAETQKKNQQAQTDFAIEKIEQQKDQAHTDYYKEIKNAHSDWQKQSNPYGVEAEKRAAAGLSGHAGYLESVQAGYYNTYQNRLAVAHEAYTKAVLNYDNAIKDAQLQNNAQLAEIAFNALQQQLQLSLQGFQYKNQLLLEQAATKREVDKTYYGRYQDVVAQINHENALAEQVRQADLANERAMKEIAIAQAAQRLNEQKFAYQKQQDAEAKAAAAVKAAKAPSGGSSSSKKGAKSAGKDSSSIRGKAKSTKSVTTTTTVAPTRSQSRNNAQIDMKSVLDLGLGPISASKLDSLVASGQVREYVSGGKRKFQWSAAGFKAKQMYSSLG